MKLVKHSHSVGETNYHIQITPKCRRAVFRDLEIKKACERSFFATAEAYGFSIESVDFGPDHAHIFATHCKNYSAPELVRLLKGQSSYELRQNYWSSVKQYLWGDSFWSRGYFYRSIGSVTSESIQFYIERSQGKHWKPLDYEFESYKQTNLDQFEQRKPQALACV